MKKYILFIILISLSYTIYGQKDRAVTDYAAMELNFAKSLWYNSTNTAGMIITPLNDYNTVSAKYAINSGKFKLQQQGDKETGLSFNTNGALKLGQTYLWGDFSFINEFYTGTKYNTNLYDACYYMPYYVSDPNLSNWNRQYYDMSFKAATVVGERIFLGLHANYLNKKGAKQKDPRSVPYNYSLFVQPSIMFMISPEHFAGLSFTYSNSYDRSATSNSDSQNDQSVYVMKGLGHFSAAAVGGIGGLDPFYYKGNQVGGALQYGFSGDFELMLDVDYSFRVIDVFQTPTKPRRMGTTINNTIDGDLQILFPGKNTHKISANYYLRDVDGVEFIQEEDRSEVVAKWKTTAQFIRSNFSYNSIGLNYDLFLGTDESYSWRLGVGAEYYDRSDIYYMPKSTLDTKNIAGDIVVKKNFSFGKAALLAGLDLGYNRNMYGTYRYGGPDAESLIITEFFKKDMEFLTSDLVKIGAELGFSCPVGPKSSILAGINYQLLSSIESAGNRNLFSLSIGLLF